jgi:branched-chain amino acid transport system substrate-binding protein
MRKYNTSGNVSDAFTVYGYSAAQTMVAVLKQCGDNLTRENVMKQAATRFETADAAARDYRVDQCR